MFPFHRVRILTDSELERFGELKDKGERSREEMLEIFQIYNAAWNTEISYCGPDCGVTKMVLSKLTKLYEKQRDTQ